MIKSIITWCASGGWGFHWDNVLGSWLQVCNDNTIVCPWKSNHATKLSLSRWHYDVISDHIACQGFQVDQCEFSPANSNGGGIKVCNSHIHWRRRFYSNETVKACVICNSKSTEKYSKHLLHVWSSKFVACLHIQLEWEPSLRCCKGPQQL